MISDVLPVLADLILPARKFDSQQLVGHLDKHLAEIQDDSTDLFEATLLIRQDLVCVCVSMRCMV